MKPSLKFRGNIRKNDERRSTRTIAGIQEKTAKIYRRAHPSIIRFFRATSASDASRRRGNSAHRRNDGY